MTISISKTVLHVARRDRPQRRKMMNYTRT